MQNCYVLGWVKQMSGPRGHSINGFKDGGGGSGFRDDVRSGTQNELRDEVTKNHVLHYKFATIVTHTLAVVVEVENQKTAQITCLF